MDTPLPDLDALTASYESAQSSVCTVCAFVNAQPPERDARHYSRADWIALLAGPRKTAAVHKVMKTRGYGAVTDGPVANHRKSGHRP